MRTTWLTVGMFAAAFGGAHAQPGITEAERGWLAAHAHPLLRTDAGTPADDLAPLGEIVGEARVVALGEGTHGTHEFFTLKHRIFEYLVDQKGFTLFAIEANQPEAELLNAYIQGGPGDGAALVAGMGFWTWNTREVLDLVEWMRTHNTRVRAEGTGRALTFAGVDMQTPDLAMAEVKRFLRETGGDEAAALTSQVAIYDQPRPGASGATEAGSVSRVPGSLLAGRRVQVSASIRTEGRAEARLWLRALDASGRSLVFETMTGRGVRSTAEFTRHAVTADIPVNAALVMFGGQMGGGGSAWFDSIEVQADDQPQEWPDLDLTFDGDALAGVWPALPESDLALDREVFHDGRGSLRIRVAAGPQGPSRDEWTRATRDIVSGMERARDVFASRAGEARTEWAIQCARLVHQWARLTPRSTAHRDLCMAENTLWVLARHPGEKMVVWAHNFHVSAIPGKQGGSLERALGEDYIAVGFSTSEGAYTAIGEGSTLRSDNTLQTPPEGSFEAVIDALGHDGAVVDLRPAASGDPSAAWLAQPRMFGGAVGAIAMPQRFMPLALSPTFDVLIHVRHTTPSRLLTPVPE